MDESVHTPDEHRAMGVQVARAGSWLAGAIRARRQEVRVAIIASAATILLLGLGFLVWRVYANGRLGWIELLNEGQPLSAQVFPETGDEPLGEPVDVVSSTTLALPDGEYRLRVTGMGLLSRTYRFAINRGERLACRLSLDQGRLIAGDRVPWHAREGEEPRPVRIPFTNETMAVALRPGQADFIEWRHQSLVRRDPITGDVVWDAAAPARPFDPSHDPGPWVKALDVPKRGRAQVVEAAPDLDGDGGGDLIWAWRSNSSIVAVSGKDGSLVWSYTAELDGPGGLRPGPDDRPEPGGSEPPAPGKRRASVVGVPALFDCDRDGTPDVIASLLFSETADEITRRMASQTGEGPPAGNPGLLCRRVLTAISGRTGRWLWTFPLDGTFTRRYWQVRDGPAVIVKTQRSSFVAVLDGALWTQLDPATGNARGSPIDLGFVPVRALQYADCDGDGEPEILALGPGAPQQQTLAAFSIAGGRENWSVPVRAWFNPPRASDPPRDWPWLFDLDSDGRCEIGIPDTGQLAPGDAYRGLRLMDGATGRERWLRALRPDTKSDDGLAHVIDAPDLDGDGTRELVAVSRYEGRTPGPRWGTSSVEPERIFVDALSGRDGHTLWRWHEDIPWVRAIRLGRPRWFGCGPDGWPLLAVARSDQDGQRYSIPRWQRDPPAVTFLEATTGRQVHSLLGPREVHIADLDGDGLADLWGDFDGELRAYEGEPPEAWCSLDSCLPAREWRDQDGAEVLAGGADLDGDGMGDTLTAQLAAGDAAAERRPFGSRTVVARSGRDGRLLWKTPLEPQSRWNADDGESYDCNVLPLPEGDVDGDGTTDVLVASRGSRQPAPTGAAAPLPLEALSGRTGRHIWRAAPIPSESRASGQPNVHWSRFIALEPGGAPLVVVMYSETAAQSPTPGAASGPYRARLAAFSGRDGRMLWNTLLQESPNERDLGAYAEFGDMEGNGSQGAVIMAETGLPAGPLRNAISISLRDGKILWSRPFNTRQPHVAIADLDGDESAEVIITDRFDKPKATCQVKVLDGRDGSVRWVWRQAGEQPDVGLDVRRIAVGNFEGQSTRMVCVGLFIDPDHSAVVLLDSEGHERTRRELRGESSGFFGVADVNGDGCDEILRAEGQRLRAWNKDLRELWAGPANKPWLTGLLPPAQGTTRALCVEIGAVGLDGATGRPLWAVEAPRAVSARPARTALLDRGRSNVLPSFITVHDGTDTVACRRVLATTLEGGFAPPQGAAIGGGVALAADPRWTRALPWAPWLWRALGPVTFTAALGLGLINVGVPLIILRLAARRRFRVATLMALPLAAAVPLLAYMTVEPGLPERPDAVISTPGQLFAVSTLAGALILAYVVMVAWCVLRRRWRSLVSLALLAAATSASVAAIWLGLDMRAMSRLDHYGLAGWYLVLLPGAQLASMLVIAGWMTREVLRLAGRLTGRRRATVSVEGR